MDPLRALAASVLEPTEPESPTAYVCPGCGAEVETVPVGNGWRRLFVVHDRYEDGGHDLCPGAGTGLSVLERRRERGLAPHPGGS